MLYASFLCPWIFTTHEGDLKQTQIITDLAYAQTIDEHMLNLRPVVDSVASYRARILARTAWGFVCKPLPSSRSGRFQTVLPFPSSWRDGGYLWRCARTVVCWVRGFDAEWISERGHKLGNKDQNIRLRLRQRNQDNCIRRRRSCESTSERWLWKRSQIRPFSLPAHQAPLLWSDLLWIKRGRCLVCQ